MARTLVLFGGRYSLVLGPVARLSTVMIAIFFGMGSSGIYQEKLLY